MMAQARASSKIKRAAVLAASRLLGARMARRGAALAPSERTALNLRAAGGPQMAPATAVVFLIPLVGRHHVGDWRGVEARLTRTLASLMAQSDHRWRALICGQDRPALPADPRIRFLPFTEDVHGNDKWRKLSALCDALATLGIDAGYAMTFDADDLLRLGTVAEMLTRQAPGGYLAQTGYVQDVQTGDVALAGPRRIAAPLRKPFWKLCGSCAALRFDMTARPEGPDLLREMTQHEHRMFPYLARLAGQRLSAFSRPSVLYLLNHGENFGARRGRVGFKTRFVQRFRISDPQILAQIRSDFPK